MLLKGNKQNWRFYISFLFLFFAWSGIIARLIYLQIIKSDYYQALAKGQQEIIQPVLGERGEIYIYDKNSKILVATNKKQTFCYLSKKAFRKNNNIVNQIASILSISPEEIHQKIQNSNTNFIILKKDLTKEEIEKIKKAKLNGIYLDYEFRRYYPLGRIASTILGFVNSQGIGNYGIEGYFNSILSGREKLIKEEHNFFGKIFEINPKELRGENIVLTIDKNIQLFSEELLKEAHENLKIRSGQIIVVNPKTGKIIALADWPEFDPNNFKEYAKNQNIFLNDAIQTLYEPGSTFKPITMAAAINEGKVTPETTYIDKGFVKIGGYTIYNYNQRVWGKRTMKDVLKYSINTGAVYAENKLGHNLFLKYLEKFKIFQKTDIELEGEIYSRNDQLKKGYKINFATAAFGQGIDLTPLNLVRAYTVFANNGNLTKLSIIDKIIFQDKEKSILPEIEKRNILNEETVKEITKMLVSVVDEGYGKRAKIPGYYIAGKTGTSQIPYTSLGIKKKGYSDETWQSFIGFFPAFDPKFLILVKLDNPKSKTAEYSACPIFKELAQYIINYYNIPPDYKTKND